MAFQSLANTTYANRTNTTVSAPAGIADGDFLFGYVITTGSPEAPDPTPPSGFTAPPGAWPAEAEVSGFNVELWPYYKVASGESGGYTFTHTNCSSQGVMMRFASVDAVTPFDTSATNNGGTGSTSTATGVTTVTDGADLVFINFDWADNTNDLTAPSGMTERLDTVLTYVATSVQTPAGATGNKVMTNNAVSGAWTALLFALRPAAGGVWPPADTPAGAPLRVSSTARIS